MTKDEEIKNVYEMMKVASETRMFRRYQVIYLRLTGKTLFETAGIVGIAKKTVDNYWAAYKEGGLEALTPQKQPGAKKKLTGQQEEEILDMIVNHVPVNYGFPVSYNWTAGIIRDYLQREYGIKYTIKGITLVLKRIGLSFTRPSYTLKKADKEKQARFIEDFEVVKKN